jgi:hypothetical protein
VPLIENMNDNRELPLLSPGQTGVGMLCAPGPAHVQRQRWMLMFDDVDRGRAIYEDEQEARAAFARAEGTGWNCYLWELSLRAPKDPGRES